MLILTGPSASGKTEIAKILIKDYGFKKFITYTTRPIRSGEVNGIDYHFVSVEEFIKMKNNNEFIETTYYNNNYYGSKRSDIDVDKVVILDPSGVNAFKRDLDNRVIIIFLDTPEMLRKERMIARGDSMEIIERRLRNDRITFMRENYLHIDYIYRNEIIDLNHLAKEINDTYKTHLLKAN